MTASTPQWTEPNQAPKKKMGRGKKLLVVAGVGLAGIVVISAAAGGNGKAEAEAPKPAASTTAGAQATPGQAGGGSKANPAADDVKLGELSFDGFGYASAAVTVTNHSSKASNYQVSVELVDTAGNRVADSFVYVSDLAPGQSSDEKAAFLKKVPESSTLKLVKVERYAA
jgi:hypothetical protein